MSAQLDADVAKAIVDLAAIDKDRVADAAAAAAQAATLATAQQALAAALASDTADKAEAARLKALLVANHIDPVTGQPTTTTPPPPPATATFGPAVYAAGSVTVPFTNVVPTKIGRDGTDSTGFGAWDSSMDTSGAWLAAAIAAGKATFTNMGVSGATFTFTLTRASGVPLTCTITIPAATTPPPATPPTPGTRTVPAPPARGWFSGAAGTGVDGGSTAFGTWRGSPVESLSTWADNAGASSTLAMLDAGGNVGQNPLPLDIAPCIFATDSGGNWAAAARGDYDAYYRTVLTLLRSKRGNGAWPTWARFGHELNGSWYPWSVYAADLANCHAAYQRLAAIRDQVYPELHLVLSVNRESVGKDFPWTDLWVPNVFDAIGLDIYNQYPWCANHAGFAANTTLTATAGEPKGYETFRLAALTFRVPIIMSEWDNHGTTDIGGDAPDWFTDTNAFLKAHCGSGPGQFYMENLFNEDKDNKTWLLYGSGVIQPKSAAEYQRLW